MLNLRIMISIFIFVLAGCATGNYDPQAGDCEKSGPIILRDLTTDVMFNYCLEKKYKLEAQKEYEDRLKDDPEFAESEAQRIKKEEEADLAEKKREEEERSNQEEAQRQAIAKQQLLFRNQKRVMKVGSDINEFQRYFGRANTEEIVNGDTVLWYDNPERPIFVVFKNNKLKSFFIDRQTIRDRETAQNNNAIRAAAERRHQENMNEAQAAREQAFWNNLTNSINNSRPVNTNCIKDMYGNLNCLSY